MLCPLSLGTAASEICQVVQSNERTAELGEDLATPNPKSSLNLAGLKAAFSSHHSSSSGNQSSVAKAANCGPTQKTLQSFFRGTVKPPNCTPSVKSPLKSPRDPAKSSPVGKSVLDGFRYGATLCDTESDKDGAVSSCDVNTAASDKCSDMEFSFPEPVADEHIVKDETPEETSDSHTVHEEAELQTEPYISSEDCTVSPDAKKARTERPQTPTEPKSNTYSHYLEEESLTVDAPVCLQRRTAPLQFSFQELAGRMKRLQDQQKQRASENLRYRRFRAKINPGENQSAEEELKKEIR